MAILNPCFVCERPVIAGPADIGDGAQQWVVVCPHCGEMTESFAEIEAAAACWNGRPASSRRPAMTILP